jgi:aminoglycoside/choline kinase family phosphotransferase
MTEPAFTWARSQQPGLDTATLSTLRAEASFRSFYRLKPSAGGSVVLMVSPPEKEQNEQFERLASVFGTAGIPVPSILAADRTRGWYLLTDLGSQELAGAYGTSAETAAIEAALATLIRLQAVQDPAVPTYTQARFADELGIFAEWFAAAFLGRELPAAVEPVFRLLVTRMPGQIQCCVHRDYHCRNLLFDPNTGRFGVVDFQDALIGPASYDLASLLHDCYHNFSDQQVSHWRDWYLEHSPLPLNPETFAEDLTLTAIQRQLKAVGIFVRLRLRDGKTTHLEHVLPVLTGISRLAAPLPELAPLSDWLAGLDRPNIAARIDALRADENR